METYLRQTDLHTLANTDRVALVTFSKNSKIQVSFTNDVSQIEGSLKRIRKLSSPLNLPKPAAKIPPSIHLWNAVTNAAALFNKPDRTRLLVVLFADEDPSVSSEIEAARAALRRSNIVLCAAAVGREIPFRQADRQVQTPPTVPGRSPQRNAYLAQIPEYTLKEVAKLAQETGGTFSRDRWNLSVFINQIRAQP